MASNRKILIIGNGPSTRELADYGVQHLRLDLDTFGMGIGYRYFREVNWWPTYYALGDSKVVLSHQAELARVIEDPSIPTSRFYLSWPVSEHPRLQLVDHGSTGDLCFKLSVELGYRTIYLIGIEGQYVEEISESRPLLDREFHELGLDRLGLPAKHRGILRIITSTPEHNPNYFFPGYQQAGDVYSLPQSQRHRNQWTQAAQVIDASDAKVLNLSVTSLVEDFPKSTITSVFDELFEGIECAAVGAAQADRPPAEAVGELEGETAPPVRPRSAVWYGPFDRERNKWIDEANLVLRLLQSEDAAESGNPSTMVDVGACKGGAFRKFAEKGWQVHAFEPHPALFGDLLQRYDLPNVTLNSVAVSDVEDDEVAFYASEESIGISSLNPFRETHQLAAKVKTIRLDNYLREHDVEHVRFLKIDTEGFELMVLKGAGLDQLSAEVIMCEFEDRKTTPLGYSMLDMARYLESFHYTVYVSEWHPVIRYGVRHQWRALKLFPCELEDPSAWGNLLAFKSDPGISALTKSMHRRHKGEEEKLPATLAEANKRIRTLERELADVYRSTSWRVTAPLRKVKTISQKGWSRNPGRK